MSDDLLRDPTKAAFSLFDEFKNFALKGNVIDLAVGVIIGGAFGKIVDSLVKDILMPVVGKLLPGQGGYEAWTVAGDVKVGAFLAAVVNFVIVAGALFLLVVKLLGLLARLRGAAAEAEPAPAPALTKDQELLIQIRDLLKRG
ncbi:MAG: large conductance mechanosensitive channel protein MscL [Planctomycetaceae bacterium]|jgi:large conductance mechanosensitive channel